MADHPVKVPQSLMEKWMDDWFEDRENADVLLIQAAQYGADQELEACCEWLSRCGCPSWAREIRAVRRPKPPSLAEQGLEALLSARGADHPNPVVVLDVAEAVKIRTALERLAGLEGSQ